MFKNPYVNALAATVYITIVATFMFYVPRRMAEQPDTVLAPIAMLSLFVLSAAVMGFLFCAQPLQLYLDGKKREGVLFFLKTVGGFAVLTLVIFLLLLIIQ